MRWLLLLLLTLPVTAESLGELVGTLKSRYPSAQVVSGFNDWRTTSIYRRHAGLHLGYDIVLPYGSGVPAAWPGRVVAITPWGSSQYGITVQGESGLEATYGHLTPLVSVGQSIAPGQLVGRTLIDHVDVKMRNAQGDYVDFGKFASAPVRVGPQRQAEDETEKWQARVAQLESLPKPLPDYQYLYEEGAISRVQAEEEARKAKAAEGVEKKLAVARARLAAARKRKVR